MSDIEMMKALEADGEKLRQLTGEDHGPFSGVPLTLEALRSEMLIAIAELNMLAEVGAKPLWSSLTARMEQIYANLGGDPVDLDPRLGAKRP